MPPRQYDTAGSLLVMLGAMIVILLITRWVFSTRERDARTQGRAGTDAAGLGAGIAPDSTTPVGTGGAVALDPGVALVPLVVSTLRTELDELAETLRLRGEPSRVIRLENPALAALSAGLWGFWAGSWLTPSTLAALRERTEAPELWALLVVPLQLPLVGDVLGAPEAARAAARGRSSVPTRGSGA